MMQRCLIAAAVLLLAAAGFCRADGDPWDSSRYMRVDEVRPGMVGYGLTVFSGDKIEKFDVEVVSVIHDLINPKSDVVLIHCNDARLDHFGAVEGMSGSPIYLFDPVDTAHQHPRMIGAFAYGWEWAKDPLAGVQPIEYMLKIPTAPATQPAEAPAAVGEVSPPRWTMADVPALPGFLRNGAGIAARSLNLNDQWSGDANGLRPLATPLMAGGFSARYLRQMSPMFASSGLALEAGGAGAADAAHRDVRLEPGAALVAPLLIGDMELSAVGTCTEVLGPRVWGFGHEANNEGPIPLPLGSGTIATVVADLHSSFKRGQLAGVVGTLNSDQTCGVAGLTGQTPPMIPISL